MVTVIASPTPLKMLPWGNYVTWTHIPQFSLPEFDSIVLTASNYFALWSYMYLHCTYIGMYAILNNNPKINTPTAITNLPSEPWWAQNYRSWQPLWVDYDHQYFPDRAQPHLILQDPIAEQTPHSVHDVCYIRVIYMICCRSQWHIVIPHPMSYHLVHCRRTKVIYCVVQKCDGKYMRRVTQTNSGCEQCMKHYSKIGVYGWSNMSTWVCIPKFIVDEEKLLFGESGWTTTIA